MKFRILEYCLSCFITKVPGKNIFLKFKSRLKIGNAISFLQVFVLGKKFSPTGLSWAKNCPNSLIWPLKVPKLESWLELECETGRPFKASCNSLHQKIQNNKKRNIQIIPLLYASGCLGFLMKISQFNYVFKVS